MPQPQTFLGTRGDEPCTLTIKQLYQLYIERAQYIRHGVTDLDASAQAFCCEIEKAMGIYPNVPQLKETQS